MEKEDKQKKKKKKGKRRGRQKDKQKTKVKRIRQTEKNTTRKHTDFTLQPVLQKQLSRAPDPKPKAAR